MKTWRDAVRPRRTWLGTIGAAVLLGASVASADDAESLGPEVRAAALACVQYQIVEGSDEVFGSPEPDRAQAYVRWKEACETWKR